MVSFGLPHVLIPETPELSLSGSGHQHRLIPRNLYIRPLAKVSCQTPSNISLQDRASRVRRTECSSAASLPGLLGTEGHRLELLEEAQAGTVRGAQAGTVRGA